MKERTKLRQFFFGDTDEFGIVLIGLYLLTYASPLLIRAGNNFELAPLTISAYFICYVFRFKRKIEIDKWDSFKLIFTTILFVVSLEYHLLGQLSDFPFILANISWVFLYYIDRAVLRFHGILTALLTAALILMTVFFVVYAQLQTNEAMKQISKTSTLFKEVEKLKAIAVEYGAKAREAEDKAATLEKELKDCQKSN